MKRNFLTGLVCFFITLSAYGVRYNLNLEVNEVFIPSKGYDDNDNVEMMLKGTFPNLCYHLGPTRYKIRGNVITIRQTGAFKKIIGCKTGEERQENGLNVKDTFTAQLSLGNLAAGDYKIIYGDREKTFSVEKAPAHTIDNVLYAPVKSLFIPDLMRETKNGEVILSGVYTSSCYSLRSADVEVLRVDNVIVVLPKLRKMFGHCMPRLKPLHLVVPLGELTAGEYLLHVRSSTGQSVSKIFQVQKGSDPRIEGL